MSESKIPENVKRYRPETCSEIKLISGHYYVYRYSAVLLASGKWGKKSGPCIGSIIPDVGFKPNKNYLESDTTDIITVLDYGQYAFIEDIASSVKHDLEQCFPLDKAAQIFSYAVILYANGFVHVDQIQRIYEQTWLPVEYKDYTFKMGHNALDTLLDDLGRKTTRVRNYEQQCIESSLKKIAIDGHAIRSCSEENDLGEAGYKFKKLGEDQVNLLMGYDINTGKPLFARMYRGSCNDKATIPDLAEYLDYSGIEFIVDRGFYSRKNLDLLSMNGNSYIIPVPTNTDVFAKAMTGRKYTSSFYYSSGKKHSRVEFWMKKISNTEKVYVYRDIDENEKCRYNYQHCIELGKAGYTPDGYEKAKEFFGVYVLQTSSKKKAEAIFTDYKKRWGIETFYQYLKNSADFNNLMMQDYYKEQGFSFIMLITGQIHQQVIDAVKLLNDNTMSVSDVLLMAKCMKLELKGSTWSLKNTRKRDLQILEKMNFKPKQLVPA